MHYKPENTETVAYRVTPDLEQEERLLEQNSSTFNHLQKMARNTNVICSVEQAEVRDSGLPFSRKRQAPINCGLSASQIEGSTDCMVSCRKLVCHGIGVIATDPVMETLEVAQGSIDLDLTD